MSDPFFDPFALQPEPIDFPVPQHEASASTETMSSVDSLKAPSVRERLMGNSGKKRGERLSVTSEAKEQKPVPPNKPGQYVKPLEEMYTALGVFAMPFHPNFGLTMLGPCRPPQEGEPEPDSVATNCAKAVDLAAQRSPAVRRMLESFMTASTLGTVVAAHVPLFLALAAGTKLDPGAAMERFLARQQKQDDE